MPLHHNRSGHVWGQAVNCAFAGCRQLLKCSRGVSSAAGAAVARYLPHHSLQLRCKARSNLVAHKLMAWGQQSTLWRPFLRQKAH
eukprot:131723-Chlamydomonas_euryale.AAC.1